MRGEDNKMKQTEIGMIPDDWEVKRLGDVGDVRMCKRVFKEQTTNDGEIPFFKIGTFGGMPDAYISRSLFEYLKTNYSYPQKGDILLSAAGTIGRTVVFDGKDAFFQDSNIIWLKNTESKILNKYLYYLYKAIDWNTEDGGVVTRLYNNNFLSTKVAFPSTLAEQKKIAQVLSDVDSVIATLEKLIAKKKNIKQGAMQMLLTGKKRLPGFAKSDKFKQTEIGEVPIDWEVRELGEVFSFLPNNTLSRDCLNYDKGEYQDIHYGDVLIKFPSVLDCQKAEIPFINNGHKVNFDKYGVKEGDIIIADTAEDETCGKVTEIYNLGDKKLVSGLHTILCRPKTDDFAPKWLGYFMNYSMYHNQLIPLITGIKVSSVSKSNILLTKILIPPKSEQTAIANVLSDMDREIEMLDNKLAKYRDLKTGMMQQLLTGRIRLRKYMSLEYLDNWLNISLENMSNSYKYKLLKITSKGSHEERLVKDLQDELLFSYKEPKYWKTKVFQLTEDEIRKVVNSTIPADTNQITNNVRTGDFGEVLVKLIIRHFYNFTSFNKLKYKFNKNRSVFATDLVAFDNINDPKLIFFYEIKTRRSLNKENGLYITEIAYEGLKKDEDNEVQPVLSFMSQRFDELGKDELSLKYLQLSLDKKSIKRNYELFVLTNDINDKKIKKICDALQDVDIKLSPLSLTLVLLPDLYIIRDKIWNTIIDRTVELSKEDGC